MFTHLFHAVYECFDARLDNASISECGCRQTAPSRPLFRSPTIFFARPKLRNKSPSPVVSPHANPHNSPQESIMKKLSFAVLSFVVLAVSSSAFAEGKTRAQVYQELIEAQQNGLDYITDSSYPDVNPAFVRQVEQRKQALAAKAAAAASRVANASAPGMGAN
jgi:hypothetical protein